MINAVTTASRLDFKGWLLGVLGAAISGGAGAVSAAFGTIIVDAQDPDKYALRGAHIFELMGWCFAISGLVSLMKFLQTHPVPEEESASFNKQP